MVGAAWERGEGAAWGQLALNLSCCCWGGRRGWPPDLGPVAVGRWATETQANMHPQPPARLRVSYLFVYLFICLADSTCNALCIPGWKIDSVHTAKLAYKAPSYLCASHSAPPHLSSRDQNLGSDSFRSSRACSGMGSYSVWIYGDEWMIVPSGDPFRARSSFLELPWNCSCATCSVVLLRENHIEGSASCLISRGLYGTWRVVGRNFLNLWRVCM